MKICSLLLAAVFGAKCGGEHGSHAGHDHCELRGRTDCWDAENDYIGRASTTVSGRTCMNWDERTPHVPRQGSKSLVRLIRIDQSQQCVSHLL